MRDRVLRAPEPKRLPVEADHLVARDAERDAFQSLDLPEGFGDVLHLEGGSRRGHRRRLVRGGHLTILSLLRYGHAAATMAAMSTAPETADWMFGLTPDRISPLFSVISRSTPRTVRRTPPLPPPS